MFLTKTIENNPSIIKAAFALHQNNLIRPDSYVIDLDVLLDNALKILRCAANSSIKLYFMLKQLGRNPYIAKKLMELGYEGAVTVDYKEAKVMMDNKIAIGNVGHLVQVPRGELEEIMLYRPQVMTVFSLEKIKAIDEICAKHGLKQDILLRVWDDGDKIYPAQEGGFYLPSLKMQVEQILKLKNVRIAGVTVFPAFLCDDENRDIEPTKNARTALKAVEILKFLNIKVKQINLPSQTCCANIKKLSLLGATHGEPGHGLSGTTPLHAKSNQPERPCVVYVSEVSHNHKNTSYCYGGGYYRRSNVENALVGTGLEDSQKVRVLPPAVDVIDYYFGLNGEQQIGQTVVMAFRFQAFVTRSDIVLVENCSSEKMKIVGIYDALGRVL
ncbi:MAG: YhfX family PLP-dependent enzyme [Elusimicrobiota bacterium]|jgi:predicted amino acid racemase|nr:YhfX family PLP-dependent enzyme [Elusimicrobiota bacterium]